MAINPGSRYADYPLVVAPVRGRPATVITPPPQAPQQISYYWWILSAGETLSSLAAAKYGDPGQWHRIADANPEVLDWLLVPAGTLVRIPVIT